MTQSSAAGSSVEGEKIRLGTRQFFPVLPIKCAYTGRKQYRFRLGIRADAEIGQAYADPPNEIHYTSSMTAVGDSVHGAVVTGWALKPLGPPHVTKMSGTHSGTKVQLSGGCLAQVDSPPREHSESAEIAARNPSVAQVRRLQK